MLHSVRSFCLVALAAPFIGAGSVSAQDLQPPAHGSESPAGGIYGRITAQRTGEPLGGALVEIRETGVRLAADVDGRFRMEGLRPGRYTVAISLLGRREATERIEVVAGRASQVDIELDIEPVTLEALTVKLDRTAMVGRLTRVPGSAHVLSSGQIAGQKLAFDDVNTLLRQVPGVTVSDEEGHGRRPNIGMRGTGVGRSAKVAVMEDGVLAAPAPYAAPSAYYFPVVGRMESIEVRKGSSQVKYGPWTTGGALNLVSSSIPSAMQGLVDVTGGADGNRKLRARVGETNGRFGFVAETYQLQTDGFKDLDTGGDTGFDLQDYLLKLRVSSGEGARRYQDLELKLGYTTEASRETYLGLADADFASSPQRRYASSEKDRLDTDHRAIQMRHFIRPWTNVDVMTVAYRNDFARNWYKLDRVGGRSLGDVLTNAAYADELSIMRGGDSEDDALLVRSNNREYVSQGVQSVLGVQLNGFGSHTLELGVRYHVDFEDRFQHDDLYRMTGGRMHRTTAGTPGSQDNRRAEASAVAVFLEDRIVLGAWTLNPGVRYESVDFISTAWPNGDEARAEPTSETRNSVEVWVPGIGVTRSIGRHAQLFGGVHRGFGPPGPGADARTEPESSVNYEVGARLESPAASVQVAGFYNDYTNILGRATLASGDSGSNELFNGGAVIVKGIEASAAYDVAAGRGWMVRLPVRAAWTYTSAEFQTGFASGFGEWGTVTAGDELPYLPKHQASANVGVEAPRWRVDVSAVSSAAMRTRAGSGDLDPVHSTDSFTVVNVSGEYGVTEWARVVASVQNVSDETYIASRRPAGARPGLPRTVTLGLRATLR